jgi:hypothetical protein
MMLGDLHRQSRLGQARGGEHGQTRIKCQENSGLFRSQQELIGILVAFEYHRLGGEAAQA